MFALQYTENFLFLRFLKGGKSQNLTSFGGVCWVSIGIFFNLRMEGFVFVLIIFIKIAPAVLSHLRSTTYEIVMF